MYTCVSNTSDRAICHEEMKTPRWLCDRIHRFLQSSFESIPGGSRPLLSQRDCRLLRPLGRYLDRFQENPQICGSPAWLNISAVLWFLYILQSPAIDKLVCRTVNQNFQVNPFLIPLGLRKIFAFQYWNEQLLITKTILFDADLDVLLIISLRIQSGHQISQLTE